MDPNIQKSGFKPYIGEGFISPNRQLVTDQVKNLVTEHPSFARAIQKRCLGPAGRMALPITFMSKYLIGSQGQVVLEDKDGVAWTIDWIAYMQSGRRLTFTRGWPAFVARHDIKDGDIFVAEIVSPEHWKVQVICSEVAYTKSYALCPDHAADVLMDVNNGQSNIEDQEACSDLSVARKSPLAFLAPENQITRRKRSCKRKSREDSHPIAGSPEKASRINEDASLSEKVVTSDSDEESEASLIDSKLFERVAEKENDEKLFVYTRKTQTQSCIISGSGVNAVCADMKAFNKRKMYRARYCQSRKEPCSQYVLHGYEYCLLHILEDASAPYKQCDFVDGQTYARCGFPVCLNILDTRLCQIHKKHNVSSPDTFSPGKDLWSILPKLGNLSLLMMATVVSHQLQSEADFWISTKKQSSHDKFQLQKDKEGNTTPNLPFEAGNVCVDYIKPQINLSTVEEAVSSEGAEVLPVKVNEENIVRYVGWKFYATGKANGDIQKSVLSDTLERKAMFADKVKGNTEKLSDLNKPPACPSRSANARNGPTDLKQTLMPDQSVVGSMQTMSDYTVNEALFIADQKRALCMSIFGSMQTMSGYAVDEVLCLSGQQRTLCAMHIQGKSISLSRFIGVCKRPWMTPGDEIHSQRKCPWIGALPTEVEGPHASHADPDVAVTHFDKKKGVHVPVVKRQNDEIISETPDRRKLSFGGRNRPHKQIAYRAVPFPLAFDTKSEDVLSTWYGQSGVFKAGEVMGSEWKKGSQCLISMKTTEVNLSSGMATDLTLASTCCKEESYMAQKTSRQEDGTFFDSFMIQPAIHDCTRKTKEFVDQADPVDVVAPQGPNVLHAASRTIKFFKKFLSFPGVKEYESQSDVSVDSLSGTEKPRVTAQLHKRFLDLNDVVGHGASKDGLEVSGNL